MRNFFGPGLKNLSFFIIAGFLLGSDFITGSMAMERDEESGTSQNVLSIKTPDELACLNNEKFFHPFTLKIEGFEPSLKDLTTVIGFQPTLRALDLSGLPITEMPDLKNARALEELNIADTLINNIDRIAKAPILRKLNLAHTKITNLSLLKDMKIEWINLCGTEVSTHSSLVIMSSSDIKYVPVDFAEVATFNNLKQVIIGMNPPPPLELMDELHVKDLINARKNACRSCNNNNRFYEALRKHDEYEKRLNEFKNNLLKLKELRPDLDLRIRECKTPHV